MATAPDLEDEDQTTEAEARAEKLTEIHKRALIRFDEAAIPQTDIRAHALLCRRFISVPGAMWEGEWGEQFENSVRVEIDKLTKGIDKIVTDYRENRIVPDFRPSGGSSDQDTADTLDGMHRADSYHFKAQQARDNAFEEACSGGFGAYRLVNDWADPQDKDSDAQRINPGLIIVDADQRVYFDPNAKLYDKSDARFAWVVTAYTRDAFEERYPEREADWPDAGWTASYDWYQPEIVKVAEYYERESVSETLRIFTHRLTNEEQRHWSSEIDSEEAAELEAKGWVQRTHRRKRERIHKYLLSGAEVLVDHGFIAGDCIPIVPVYFKRWFVENVERFRGYVSKLMDAQRIYNAKVSKLSETDALAPREVPIFLTEQMPPNLQTLWEEMNLNRSPYALVAPMYDNEGNLIASGPIGKIEPPQIGPVTATLLQVAANDLTLESDDGADEVKANTSAEAMDIAAARIDAKSAIPLDNMRQSVQREGEIYLSMAGEVYYEPGREVETMTEEGDDGTAVLHEPFTDKQGRFGVRNNFSSGRYKVIADVTEATATRRDKTVKQMMALAQVEIEAGDMEGAQAAVITAALNLDGEGLGDYQKWNRRRALKLGLVEPNEEEAAAMQQAAENAEPDPMQAVAQAQAQALAGQAAESEAKVEKMDSEVTLNEAKTIQTLADAAKKRKEATQPADDTAPRPKIRMGRDLAS